MSKRYDYDKAVRVALRYAAEHDLPVVTTEGGGPGDGFPLEHYRIGRGGKRRRISQATHERIVRSAHIDVWGTGHGFEACLRRPELPVGGGRTTAL